MMLKILKEDIVSFLELTPDSIIIGVGGEISKIKSLTFFDHHHFYFKDFFTQSYLVHRPQSLHRFRKSDLLNLLEEFSINFQARNNDDELFAKDFEHFKQAHKENPAFQKVVLVSREYYATQAKSDEPKVRAHWLKRSLSIAGTTAFGHWSENQGMIGATPEVLWDYKNETLTLQSLAATAKEGEESELLNEKNQHEFQLVVKGIEEACRAMRISVSKEETNRKHFGKLIHLQKIFHSHVSLTSQDLIKLTNLLSPTAALGGSPKKNSLEFLEQKSLYQQKYPLRKFGSAFGYLEGEVGILGKFIVAIRNIQWNKDGFFIESGAGIVNDSLLELELNEISMKRNSILQFYL
ncbi:MAG: chorismate-binding protein [Bacteriovoracaceae bacterium]|nr:chorismate-binding protein [Bacteriovoracaceae bacterium]